MGDEDVDQVLDDFESTMNALDIGTIRMDRQRAEKLRAALNASGTNYEHRMLIRRTQT